MRIGIKGIELRWKYCENVFWNQLQIRTEGCTEALLWNKHKENWGSEKRWNQKVWRQHRSTSCSANSQSDTKPQASHWLREWEFRWSVSWWTWTCVWWELKSMAAMFVVHMVLYELQLNAYSGTDMTIRYHEADTVYFILLLYPIIFYYY